MPELPEVEFTRRQITQWVSGQCLHKVELGPHTLPKDSDVLAALAPVVGSSLVSVERSGKYLFLGFEGGWVCSHLAMTGKWLPMSQVGVRGRFVRFQLHFDEHVLAFLDTRKLGKLDPLPTQDWQAWLRARRVGLDVFDSHLTAAVLHEKFLKTRRQVKSVLLDQKVLAGVGNIYACEALFLARVPPTTRACDLGLSVTDRILKFIRQVMEMSLAREEGEEIYYLTEGNPENPFLVYGRKGKPCTHCGCPISRISQQGRSTFFCAQCQ